MESTGRRPAPLNILVIEDEAVSRTLITKVLIDAGHQVRTAANGKDALDYLKDESNRADIVITDALMPTMDGFEFIFHLNAHPRMRRIPVVITSTLNDADSVKRAVSLGAADYVVKPIEPETLLKKVVAAVRKSVASVLVVDDEELLRDLLTSMLRRDGYRALVASDGVEALEVMAEESPALVIADVYMPNMGGIELLDRIRKTHPGTPVLLVSGRPSFDLRRRAKESGAAGLVTKPFKNDEVRATISSILKAPAAR